MNDAASCATIGATEFVSGQCRFNGGGTISGNPPAMGACVPPDKSADTCEGKIVKAVGTLTVSIAKCQAKGAHLAFKGVPFDEDACEALAKTKFDKIVAKLPASCPTCVRANATAFRDHAQAFVDTGSPLAFCAGATPLP